MIEIDARWTVDTSPWEAKTTDDHRASLILAIFALNSDTKRWIRRQNTRSTWGLDVYAWCHKGWELNGRRGYIWAVSNALRPFVVDGDLTQWWRKGRSKQEVLNLFMKAVEV